MTKNASDSDKLLDNSEMLPRKVLVTEFRSVMVNKFSPRSLAGVNNDYSQ